MFREEKNNGGPTVDGARGVSIVAPGGAVTSVPTFTHKDSQLMHGTSMASPHAAGCIALMISSARQMDFPFSPYSVRRAIENAAFKVPELDIFAQGHGLIQMEPAVNLLKELSNSPDRDVNYNVTINSHQKGIHLRGNYGELKRPREFTVSVEPKFFKSKKLDPEQKLAFHARFVLINDASWIQCPDHVDMSYGVKTFSVRIDPKNIPSTGPHLHFIQAYHVGQIQLGPVWEIPVAVMVPEPPSSPVEPRSSLVSLRGGGPIPAPAVCDHKFVSTQMKGGDVFRKFLTVPTGAAWAVVKVTVSNLEKSCRYLLHTVQLSPEKSCRTNEHHKWLSFGQDGNYKTSFPVVPELALEVCLAKNWSSHGVSDVTLELTFHGYVTSEGSSQLTFLGSQGVKKVDLLCTLRPMEMMPSIVFKHLVAVLRPQESRVVPLPLPRDLRSEGRRNYMLMLKYQFHLTRTTEVRPISPLLSGYLYESEFEAQLIIIQDAHRRIHLVADAYPFKYSKKLDKGEYIVLQYIRHDKLKLLESMADIPLHIEQKLGSSISLDCYPSWTAAVSEGKKILPRSLQTGDCVPVYISTHVTDKTYKNATAGSFLTGTVSWVKDEPGKKASSYPATMVVPEPPNYKKNSNTSPTRSSGKCPPTGKEKEKDGTDSGAEDGGCGPLPKGESSASLSTAASSSDVKCPPPTAAPGKKKSKEEEFAEAERDLRVAWIYKLDPKGKGKELYEELDSKWSAHVPLHLARMNALDTADDKTGALEMANKVISLIDETKLLMFFGHKTLPADMAKNKSAMERERGWLCEALAKKGTILLQQGTDREEVERVWTTLLKFVDCHGQTVVNFTVAYCTEKGWYSKAIRAIQKQMTEKNSIALEEKLEKVFELVGWVHLQRLTQRNKLVKFPNWRHLP
ncbi:unnamed protein product [Cyprideis torosa]|uniref:Tripeptidyl-peptidase 2 n=2 Tax=Cyprideis torosa TaxID=163714 RepID=A0A7R8W8K2_9CRUS|nr:unnamed protein product [Cyprideis torosa]CAG0888705.1 unnamed protein product [Cyprideis torosa]